MLAKLEWCIVMVCTALSVAAPLALVAWDVAQKIS